jgi:hypothetical protein
MSGANHIRMARLEAENERLRAALKECAADWSTPRTTAPEVARYVAREFVRRMEIAGRALEQQKDGKLAGPIEFAPEALAADASIKQDGGTVD